MAIAAGDFRTGLTLIVDGDPWVVLDFQHVKPGKGAAILKTKMKEPKDWFYTGQKLQRFNKNSKLLTLKRKQHSTHMKLILLIISWIWKHMILMNYQKNRSDSISISS